MDDSIQRGRTTSARGGLPTGLLLLPWLLAGGCATTHGGGPGDVRLSRYLACRSGDQSLVIVETKRMASDAPPFREVTVGERTQRVSVIDGYRVLHGFQDVYARFANVKIERSDPGAYAADKETLIAMQKAMPSVDKVAYRHLTLNGLEIHGVDKPNINVGGVAGSYVIFADADQVVVSIYFVNDPKGASKIPDMKGYQVVRDRFLDDQTRCFAARAGTAVPPKG